MKSLLQCFHTLSICTMGYRTLRPLVGFRWSGCDALLSWCQLCPECSRVAVHARCGAHMHWDDVVACWRLWRMHSFERTFSLNLMLCLCLCVFLRVAFFLKSKKEKSEKWKCVFLLFLLHSYDHVTCLIIIFECFTCHRFYNWRLQNNLRNGTIY